MGWTPMDAPTKAEEFLAEHARCSDCGDWFEHYELSAEFCQCPTCHAAGEAEEAARTHLFQEAA